jgi:hypothetical protein
MFDDTLKQVVTSENFITVDLQDSEFGNEENIIVTVHNKADTNATIKRSDSHSFKRMAKTEKEKVSSQLNELMNVLSEETALNKFILAGFFEQHKLLVDANTVYQQAIRLAGDNQTYKDEYNHFLFRAGIRSVPAKR